MFPSHLHSRVNRLFHASHFPSRPGARSVLPFFLLASLWALSIDSPAARADTPTMNRAVEHTFTTTTAPLLLDRYYGSMQGPSQTQRITIGSGSKPELLWLTGFQFSMETDGTTTGTREAQRFNCHSMMHISDPGSFRGRLPTSMVSSRLFTLSQGQSEIRFPQGFGLPIYSDQEINLNNQALNLNPGPPINVSHRTVVHYLRDADIRDGEVVPLFVTEAYGMVLLKGESPYFGVSNARQEKHGPGCHFGSHARIDSDGIFEDSQGQRFSTFWILKPGRDENHTLVTRFLDLPYNTTLHYAAVHLHPFAESLELRDLTTNTTVFKSLAENSSGRIGLSKVTAFSSVDGVPMFRDHEYELFSVYNNTTSENHDVMASAFLYLRDKTFKRPNVLRRK